MAKSVEDIIAALVTVEQGLTGISGAGEAHAVGPEQIAALPMFLNYPSTGALNAQHVLAPSKTRDEHRVIAELYVSRGVLPEAETITRPFIERFRAALSADVTLAGACATCFGAPMAYEYGGLEYGNDTYLGVRFILTCIQFQ